MDHTEEEIDGKDVEVFQVPHGQPPVFFGVEPDGAPFAVGFQNDFSDPLLKFVDFKQGAGDIEEMSCNKITATELVAHPKAPKAFAVLGQLMKAMRKNPTMEVSMGSFPTEFSDMFLSAAGTEA